LTKTSDWSLYTFNTHTHKRIIYIYLGSLFMSNRIRQITSLTTALGSVEEGILTRCVLFVSTEESFHGPPPLSPSTQNLRRPSTRGHTRPACVTINVGRKRTGDKWDSPSRGAPTSTPLHYMYMIYIYIYTHTHYIHTVYGLYITYIRTILARHTI